MIINCQFCVINYDKRVDSKKRGDFNDDNFKTEKEIEDVGLSYTFFSIQTLHDHDKNKEDASFKITDENNTDAS